MKHFFLSATLFAFLGLGSFAQTQRVIYSRVKISGTEPQLRQLLSQGLIDHFHRDKTGIVAELADTEIDQLRTQGYAIETLQADMASFYANRLAHAPKNDKAGGDCSSELGYTDPTHFHLGSMGGYLTYSEVLAELDAMATQYPAIFKPRAEVSTFLTYENRPLHWVKISDNPTVDESEPRVFYNSLIHAREGISVMQLVYFMWYVLENYDSNPEIKYLVDNSEMYFIPVVNPDGYVYNETTDPNGGGMHRKNLRPTGGNNPGVDLNRNFSYQWGVSGTSNNVTNDTYLGPSAFSEPETQAFKWFAEQYHFTAALTHHSYANLLMWPYGYDDVQTADDALYTLITTEMVTENHFTNEQSVTLYPAAGDTDDWMYTTSPEKPKVLAMTPESGDDADGFWPAQNRILPMSRANLKMNLDLARFVVKYGISKPKGASWISGTTNRLAFDFKRFGLVNGDFTVSLQSLSAQATVTGAPVLFSNPAQLSTLTDSIAYTVSAGTPAGTELRFVLITDNGIFQLRDTVSRIYGNPGIILNETADNLANWTSIGGSWGTTASTFVSAPTSITDSPSGNYANSSTTGIVLNNPVNLSTASAAVLNFWARWDVEAGYDYVQLEASTDGSTWTPLCGRYTKPGNANQTGASGEPLYDGTQTTWVQEEILLDAYVGSASLKFRFRLRSDNGVNGDGFYFDDFVVKALTSNNAGVAENTASHIRVYPNPSNGHFSVSGTNGQAKINIYNTTGKLLRSFLSLSDITEIDLEELSNGLYFVEIRTGNHTQVIKITLAR